MLWHAQLPRGETDMEKTFSLTQGGIPVFLIKPNSKTDRRAALPTIPSPFDRFVSNLVEGHLSRFRSCIMTPFEKECDSRKMELHRGAARDRRVQPGNSCFITLFSMRRRCCEEGEEGIGLGWVCSAFSFPWRGVQIGDAIE